MESEQRIAEVLEALRASRKYRDLADAALVRIASWAAVRHANTKDAIKAAKRKLHQAQGAYFDGGRLPLVDRALAALEVAAPEDVPRICREALSAHASTAERLPIVEQFYDAILAVTGRPQRVIDLACGLNPFALPWMKLDAQCHYGALEVDERLVARIRRFFQLVEQPHTATCVDLLSPSPSLTADVALLLKSAPCLEQQEPGAFRRVFDAIDARWIVVSFPIASLGGREVGMRNHYRAFIEESGLPAPAEIIEFATELAFIFHTH